MIISFSGNAGSGKSTLAKKLAKELNWPRYYIGGLRRAKARERGMTLAEYNKLGETDISTDKEVDEHQKELGKKEDDFIIEGRTSWHFIPHSLKIYIHVDHEEGAKRIFKDLEETERNEDSNLDSIEAVIKSNRRREESDNKRYLEYYNIKAYDKDNYDFILDTTTLTADVAYKELKKYVLEILSHS